MWIGCGGVHSWPQSVVEAELNRSGGGLERVAEYNGGFQAKNLTIGLHHQDAIDCRSSRHPTERRKWPLMQKHLARFACRVQAVMLSHHLDACLAMRWIPIAAGLNYNLTASVAGAAAKRKQRHHQLNVPLPPICRDNCPHLLTRSSSGARFWPTKSTPY